MATFQKRVDSKGKTRWRALVRMKGQTATKWFPRKAEAQTWASETEDAIRHRRYFATQEAERHTVQDLIDRRKLEIEGDPAKQAAGVGQQLDWWGGQIGKLSLVDLTPAVLAECRDRLAKDKSNPTANRYLAVMSKALNQAVREWGWIQDNPMRHVARKPENKGRVRFLSDDERKALLKACKDSDLAALHPIVVLALATGMRQGEILSLTWPQVDLKRGWITLTDTKNGDRRGLPLSGHALAVMEEYGKVRHLKEPRVFPGLERNKGDFRAAWVRAVQAAGLTDFRFHDLRHSAASALLMSGASLGEIADVLGHRTLQMVQRYSHIADDHRAKVVAKMNQGIFEGEG